jgi:hypothetical protein
MRAGMRRLEEEKREGEEKTKRKKILKEFIATFESRKDRQSGLRRF